MPSRISNAIESLKNKSQHNLSNFLAEKIGNKEVVIYGAGGFGKEIAGVLLKNNIKINSILDIKATGSLFNIPIQHPEKFQNKDLTVILSIVLNKATRKEICDFLKKLGFNTIIDAQEIRAMYVELEGAHDIEYFSKKKEDILRPLNFLADEESIETYIKNVVAHISRNYENTYETNETEQYFVNNIPFKKGFDRFIDCGAYIGDTFEKLISLNPSTEMYVGFEPIQSTFKKLVDKVSSQNIKSVVIPSAVSDKTGIIKFNSLLGSSSSCENGNVEASSVKVDDILHNINPTFIKMDIEGEEIKALNGAKKTIVKSQPELAICVYHYINHFWEIPNLIESWNLGYKFYLRTHSSACMETVLYAVKERN